MASFTISGFLLEIGQTQEVSEKFKKREFVLELVETINGNNYTNYGKFQTVQAKCDLLNSYRVGDNVTVSFNVKGNSYVDKKDGTTKYITNLDAWRIEAAGGQQTQEQNGGGYAQPQQQAPPQQSSGGYQQPAYQAPPAGGYQPSAQQPTYNYGAAPSGAVVDDLPF